MDKLNIQKFKKINKTENCVYTYYYKEDSNINKLHFEGCKKFTLPGSCLHYPLISKDYNLSVMRKPHELIKHNLEELSQ